MFSKKNNNIQIRRIRKTNMPSSDTIESRHAFHQNQKPSIWNRDSYFISRKKKIK